VRILQNKWKSALCLNQKAEFVLADQTLAASMIQGIEENSESGTPGIGLMVTIPVRGGKEHLLEVGSDYQLLIYGVDRIYALLVRVVQRKREDVPLYAMSVMQYLGEIQRRQNVRIMTNLPVRFLEIPVDPVRKTDAEGWIADLSAGGIRMLSEKKMSVGQRVLLKFSLGEISVSIGARICHRRLWGASHHFAYAYGMAFCGQDQRTEDKIVRYVFKRMQQSRALE
jgi:c-di-GMP-binding flagellar brake protein YcgR